MSAASPFDPQLFGQVHRPAAPKKPVLCCVDEMPRKPLVAPRFQNEPGAGRRYLQGEHAAEAFLVRVAQGQALHGELSTCVADHGPAFTAGFFDRVQRCLAAHFKDLS